MLRLWIQGNLSGEADGAPLEMPTSERARALVGWLALHPGHHPRSEVAARLWPDTPAGRSRANLRTAVWAVRRAWGPAGRYVETTRSTIGLAAEGRWLDVREEVDAESVGDLLPGLEDDWVAQAREDHRVAVVQGLVEQADTAEQDGDVIAAVRLSHQICRISPLDEPAHRALLHRLLLAGDRAGAVLASREFVERLRSELGVRPSPATRAVQASARSGTPEGVRPRLFGRAAELAGLSTLWKAACGGAGQVVVLTGEAGIGKSSIVSELAHRVAAAGGRSSIAVGVDAAGQTPFGAWLELCQGLVGSVAPVDPRASWPAELNRLSGDLGERLGHPGPPPAVTAPELERLRVFEAVLRLVEWSAADRPTLIALDDAHRADRASLRLTAHVGRRIARLSVLLVLTVREGAASPELDAVVADLSGRGLPVTEIALPPIDDQAIAALVSSVHTLDGDDVRRVVAAAEGNPLLAVESTRVIASGSTGPPPTLLSAMRAASGRLPIEAVELVQLLAVAGRPLKPAELDRLDLAGITGAEDAACVEGLLVHRSGGLGFRHELLREAVCADLRNPARLHERVAAALDPTRPADVAHHLSAAGRDVEAARCWAAAAADARKVGALDEAADFLIRATSSTPRDGRPWLELEEVLAWSGRRSEMEAAWEHAMRLLPESELAAAWSRRGRQLRSVVCHPDASLAAYRQAQDLMGDDSDPRLRAEVHVGLAWGDAVAGDGELFEAHLTAAEALLPGTPDATTSSDIGEIRMQGLIRQARFVEAVAVASTTARHAISARLPDHAFTLLVNAACALTCVGDYEGALACADRAVAATSGVPSILVGSLATRAQILARLGRHEEAAETVRREQELAQRLDAPELAATAKYDAGMVALAAGHWVEAAELLDRALAEGAQVSRPTARLHCARARALAGDDAGARRALRAGVLEPVGQADQPWSLVPRIAFVQGLIAQAAGDVAEAGRRFDEAESAWHRVLSTVTKATAEGYLANLVDLGRPPVLGLVEPVRELESIEEARRGLLGRVPAPAPAGG